MFRKPVVSSNVKSVGYDEASKTLEVEFNQGGLYAYSNVPKQVYESLMNASSIGSYLADNIKNVYSYRKIG